MLGSHSAWTCILGDLWWTDAIIAELAQVATWDMATMILLKPVPLLTRGETEALLSTQGQGICCQEAPALLPSVTITNKGPGHIVHCHPLHIILSTNPESCHPESLQRAVRTPAGARLHAGFHTGASYASCCLTVHLTLMNQLHDWC